jgi:acetyl esterase/lipase
MTSGVAKVGRFAYPFVSVVRILLTCIAALMTSGVLPAANLSPSEAALLQQLGRGTPEPIPLWPDKPPRFVESAPAETVDANAHIKNVSVPTVSVYLPSAETHRRTAIIVCPGGGYGALDWKTHVVYAAQVFNAKGVVVIGLKYRLRPPNGRTNDDIQQIALLDAQRAVRLVRQRAGEWDIDPNRIGIVGYSAGANLAMNLAAHFDAGDANATDPVERQSCRPDFAVGLATWHWRQKESPFHFGPDTPPVFLVHATDDGITGGAPIELPRAIEADLKKIGVPVHLEVFDEGGHGVGNLIPQRVEHGFPPAKWPELLLSWLGTALPKSDPP